MLISEIKDAVVLTSYKILSKTAFNTLNQIFIEKAKPDKDYLIRTLTLSKPIQIWIKDKTADIDYEIYVEEVAHDGSTLFLKGQTYLLYDIENEYDKIGTHIKDKGVMVIGLVI